MRRHHQKLLIVQAVLGALVFASAGIHELEPQIGTLAAHLLILAIGAAQVGVALYMRGASTEDPTLPDVTNPPKQAPAKDPGSA